MKIVTWNIAEARRSRSHAQFDYDTEDVDYFVSQLRAVLPDIVCLQESYRDQKHSLSLEIAQALGFDHCFETPTHSSHINPEHTSTLAILSRETFHGARTLVQPYPACDLKLPNGQPARKIDEYVQIVAFDGFYIANTKTQPMEFLGHAYETPAGQIYAAGLSKMFAQSLPTPLILAGDFNTPDPSTVFAAMCEELQLKDVLPAVPTKPNYHGHLDCIFASSSFEVSSASVVPTESDHFLGWAEIKAV
jgi:endonuclease/exonuclease/phosphatase family metal-dependent hydrolase